MADDNVVQRRHQAGAAEISGFGLPSTGWFSLTPLALLVMVALVLPLATRDLWSTDELRYTSIAREMAATGHWILPHLNGEPYTEKPPLYFWMTALAGALTGNWQLAGRLVALLSLLGTAALVLAIGRMLFADARIGGLGAILFVTFLTSVDHGQEAGLDVVLGLFTTATIAALIRAGSMTGRAQQAGWTVLAAIALVGGALTKGPMALLAPPIAALGFTLAGRRRLVPPLGVLLVSLLGAAVVILWLLLVASAGGTGFDSWQAILAQIERRMGPNAEHGQPFWFYLAELPRLLAPWSVLLPGTVALIVRDRNAPTEPGSSSFQSNLTGLLLWAGLGIFALSFVAGKRSGYIQAFIPPLALPIAYGILHFDLRSSFERRLFEWPLALVSPLGRLLAATGLLSAISWSVWSQFSFGQRADRVIAELPPWTPWALFATGVASFLLARIVREAHQTRQFDRVAMALASLVAIGGCLAAVVYAGLNAERSAIPFFEQIAAELPPEAPLVLLDSSYEGRMILYTGILHNEVVDEAALVQKAGDSGNFWVISDKRAWQHVAPETRAHFEEIVSHEMQGGRRGFLLLHRRP